MSQERYSSGFRKHIRNEKAQLRREQQPYTTYPSWETVWGIIELRTLNNEADNSLVNNNRNILHSVYNGYFDLASGKGRKKLDKFTSQYTINKKSKLYNPELIDSLSPYITMVRESFPSLRSTRR